VLKNPGRKAVKDATKDLTPGEQQLLEDLGRVVQAGGLNCGLGGSLLKLKPRNLDGQLIAELLGPRRAATAEELCLEFGISAAEFAEWERQVMTIGDPRRRRRSRKR